MLFFTIIFDELHLYPMSFEEFLLANGENKLAQYCRDYTCGEASAFSDRYIQLLKEYYVVGGMPEVVKCICIPFDICKLFIYVTIHRTPYIQDINYLLMQNKITKLDNTCQIIYF